MKKTLILAVVAVAVMAVSCRKDRTCTCNNTTTTTPSSGSAVVSSETSVQTATGIKKNDPRWDCNSKTVAYTYTYTGGSALVSTVYDCTLK